MLIEGVGYWICMDVSDIDVHGGKTYMFIGFQKI